MSDVILQIIAPGFFVPDLKTLEQWINLTLPEDQQYRAITVRVVDKTESQALNTRYRNQPKPTNILSFPFDPPMGIHSDLLGDLVVCPEVIEQEAREQGKLIVAHWAHLIVHGTLHLLDYNHLNEHDAAMMESKEIDILSQLNFPNPYEI